MMILAVALALFLAGDFGSRRSEVAVGLGGKYVFLKCF